MTLTEFLLARIADDETEARDAGADAMIGHRWKHAPEDVYGELQATVLANSRRVLAECEAKRRIVELHDETLKREVRNRDQSAIGADLMHLDVLRLLAAPHADHEDYDESWRP